MGKRKVTLDTNILVSALGWKGKSHEILSMIVDGKLELVLSFEQFAEVSKVLEYPKFNFTDEQKARFKALLLKIATFVQPRERLSVIRDQADNRILECAVAGDVNYIVSGDHHLLDLKEFSGIKIVTAREMLRILGAI